MATTPNYAVDYEDERFQQVDEDIAAQETNLNQTYGNMINNSDQYYNKLIENTENWADKQSQIQQEKTDFAIEQIEQQKDQAQKDYIKEQSGAYVDWQNQSNQYGANAEKMASSGLTNTGYSESSQVSMYNTYQNRVATARESYNNAVLNYNNMIKDAQIQNNAALAEIAYNALQQSLELSLQGFQYKNNLIIDLTDKQMALDDKKWGRYQDILNQINTENALAEDVRQFEETQKWNTEQKALDREFQAKEAEINRKFEAEQAELNRKHDIAMLNAKTKAEKELLEAQHKKDLEKLKKQHEYELAEIAAQKKTVSTAISGSSSKKVSGTKSSGKKTSSGTKMTAVEKSTANKAAAAKSTTSKSSNNILDMGYGPISAKKASQLVDEGKLTYKTDKSGNVTFQKKVTLPTMKLYR